MPTSLLMQYAETRKMTAVRQFAPRPFVSMFNSRFTPSQSDIIPFVRVVCLREPSRCFSGSIEALNAETQHHCSLDDLAALREAGLIDYEGNYDGSWLRVTWKGC